jgi:hypothetical protein
MGRISTHFLMVCFEALIVSKMSEALLNYTKYPRVPIMALKIE